jgi:hypothetical protein
MGKRMLDSQIWESKQFTNLSFAERLLYIGLITIADDNGRFKSDPKFLKGKLFTMDNTQPAKIKKMLEDIQKSNLICIYIVNDEQFGFHPNWENFQKIREDRRKFSSIPTPTSTTCQPNNNQKTAQDNIIKDNIIKPSIREIVAKAAEEINPELSQKIMKNAQ